MVDLFSSAEYNSFIFDFYDLGNNGYKLCDGFLYSNEVIVQSEFRPYCSIPNFPKGKDFKFKTDIGYENIPEEYLICSKNVEWTSKIHLVNNEILFNKTNRKILRRLEGSYTLHECDDVSFVYGLLVENRSKLGAKLSLSENYFKQFRLRFPRNIKMFVLRDSANCPRAATILFYRSKSEVYVYAWGHVPDSENGVMSVMASKLFNEMSAENIRIVDLGMNYDSERKIKASLVAFKRGLGAKLMPVLTIVNENV